ncbi:NADP-dependent oxidoreductase [Paraburkholderia aspalathi]|uniref:NADP-dependent oxidoreductase n=1 Tax=Paraburkholderia TaxID=1822464 RepID=UPI0038BCEEE8
MKAIVYDRFGGPEVLDYREVPDPKLSQNSVLIRVKAAALNPADIVLQAGLGESHTSAWFPVIPGWDVAGVVDSVGPGVKEFAPGDEVISYIREEILHHGGYAEMVAVPVHAVVRKPVKASWEESAGLPLAGLTAYRAIVQTLAVTPQDVVLIHGASGGVGLLAAQLARNAAARVIGTASMSNHNLLRTLGVEPVEYGEGLVGRIRQIVPEGVTAVLDCVGHGTLRATATANRADARVCSVADAGPEIVTVFARQDPDVLRRLAQIMDDGKLRVIVAQTYPLREAANAQRALARRHSGGKVVLVPPG